MKPCSQTFGCNREKRGLVFTRLCEADRGLKIRPLVLPDKFIDHASPAEMYAEAGLDAAHIVAAVLNALGRADEVGSPKRA